MVFGLISISKAGLYIKKNKQKKNIMEVSIISWVTFCQESWLTPQAAQTLFVIYIRDSIALPFEPFKRMYENGSKIALNSTCSKGFK